MAGPAGIGARFMPRRCRSTATQPGMAAGSAPCRASRVALGTGFGVLQDRGGAARVLAGPSAAGLARPWTGRKSGLRKLSGLRVQGAQVLLRQRQFRCPLPYIEPAAGLRARIRLAGPIIRAPGLGIAHRPLQGIERRQLESVHGPQGSPRAVAGRTDAVRPEQKRRRHNGSGPPA